MYALLIFFFVEYKLNFCKVRGDHVNHLVVSYKTPKTPLTFFNMKQVVLHLLGKSVFNLLLKENNFYNIYFNINNINIDIIRCYIKH